MKAIDPKYIMWLGLVVTLEQAIGHGTVSLTNVIPVSWTPYVTSWCNLLAFFGTSVMTYQAAVSGPQTGPLINLPAPPTNVVSIKPDAIVKILLAAFVLSMFLAANPASAATLKPLQITGNVAADNQANFGSGNALSSVAAAIDPEKLIQKIIAIAQPDLVYSMALAKNANTNPSNVRYACWSAIYDLNSKASGAGLKDPTTGAALIAPPAGQDIFTKAEQIAEGIDSLSPTGPLYTSCAGAAALAAQGVLTFINTLVAAVAIAPK